MSNPLLKDNIFKTSAFNNSNATMTTIGTINKSIILWMCLVAGALYSWTHTIVTFSLLLPISIVASILSMIIIFKKNTATILAPLYAICEGLILGTVSVYFNNYTGIVTHAILLTLCVLICMLASYKSGILRYTSSTKKIILLSTLTISVIYFIDFILHCFGINNIFHINSISGIGIIISLIIVIVAALNLLSDFDLIENGVSYGAPKYMEWYSSFALMITVIWLYLEILKLLFKIKNIEK
ncbi:MAG: Bax inhibitor-1/YccA family protein [Endomicrobium sp.]|jgi:uncharacterized YccA/Bax inhibitor family protein|nr:Bax inhibitor-1/YccA family protein [Endomicrobium sp.]